MFNAVAPINKYSRDVERIRIVEKTYIWGISMEASIKCQNLATGWRIQANLLGSILTCKIIVIKACICKLNMLGFILVFNLFFSDYFLSFLITFEILFPGI